MTRFEPHGFESNSNIAWMIYAYCCPCLPMLVISNKIGWNTGRIFACLVAISFILFYVVAYLDPTSYSTTITFYVCCVLYYIGMVGFRLGIGKLYEISDPLEGSFIFILCAFSCFPLREVDRTVEVMGPPLRARPENGRPLLG